MNCKVPFAILVIIGVVLLLIAPPVEEPKPDGNLYLYLNGKLIGETHLGHREVMDFCRNDFDGDDYVISECSEMFYGCGAINCKCEFEYKNKDFASVLELIKGDS